MSAILALPDGLHRDVPEADYHARIPGLASKGALDLLERSGAHYQAWLDGAVREETAPLIIGKAFHCATLEPDDFTARYVIQPDFGDCRFKEAKAKRDGWRAELAGRIALDASDWRTIEGMSAAVRSHPVAGRMLRNGVAELTLKWTDPETGLICKARGDYHVESLDACFDLKSTDDARAHAFRQSVARYRYHVQQAFYSDGFAAAGARLEHFTFVAVEKVEPYAVAIYNLDADALKRGAMAARRNLTTLAECVESGTYPGYETSIQTLDLPAWA